MVRLKYPRKIKKALFGHFTRKNRLLKKCRMVDPSTTLHKLIDYEFCTNNAHIGYVASWPEIVNHRLYKEI